MTTHRLPESWSGRLHWVLAESALVAAVFAFWLVVAAVLTIAVDVLAELLQGTPLWDLRFVPEILSRIDLVWAAVVPLTAAATALYVLARAGTIVVDRYQRANDE